VDDADHSILSIQYRASGDALGEILADFDQLDPVLHRRRRDRATTDMHSVARPVAGIAERGNTASDGPGLGGDFDLEECG
jgi:hypothetical protein